MNNKTIEKGIIQRPNGSFLVHVYRNGKRKTATVKTLKDARETRTLLESDLILGTNNKNINFPDRTSWTLGYASAKCLEVVWQGTASYDGMVRMTTQLQSYWGSNIHLEDIDGESIDRWTATLSKESGNTPATINRKLSCLSRIMRLAYERGALSSPPPKMHRKREAEGRIRFLTDREEDILLNTLRGWGKFDHCDAVVVLLDTGMRTGELFNLKKMDINKDVINVWKTKNGCPRSIPMTKRVKEIINRRWSIKGDKIFPKGKHWLRHTWDRAKAHMGLENDTQFVPHALRHTCASRLVQRGVPLPVVKEWLGHKTIQVTMRYSHLSPKALLDSVHVLEPNKD